MKNLPVITTIGINALVIKNRKMLKKGKKVCKNKLPQVKVNVTNKIFKKVKIQIF